MYAYEQALLALGFYPNIWYQAALFLEDRSKQLFEKGVGTVVILISACFLPFLNFILRYFTTCLLYSLYSIPIKQEPTQDFLT